MSPTRRDTLKAAGAASGLAMLGGHAVAQQGTPGSDDDNPGAQTLEEGQAGVRVGHFVSGAPAVNVRLVPADGSTGTDDSAGDGGTDTPTETENDSATGGNESDDNTTEDLQLENDSNETNDTDDGLVGNDSNDTNDTDDAPSGGTTADGEGELIAENVAFGDVSEYANVEAGDYTVQIVEYVEETTDEPTGTDNTTDNTTDNASEDDPIISLPDDITGNDSDDNETGNTSDDNSTFGNDTDNESGNTSDNTSEDFQLENDTNTTNDTDDMPSGDTSTDGEVLYEEDVTVGETYYTVAAVGTADDIQTILVQDYDVAQVRLVHASPDAPGVDVVAPDASMTLFDGVTFGQATEYVGVPPGSYSLSVREAADMNDGDEIGTSDVEVEAGEAYSVYAVGSPEGGEEEFDLVVEQDGQGADAGLGREGAPGQQGGGPGQGNQTNQSGGPGQGNQGGGPGGDGPPGRDNDSDGPGQSGNRGGPNADESDQADDEPGGPGGASGPNNPGDNESGNDSGTETEEDDGLFAF